MSYGIGGYQLIDLKGIDLINFETNNNITFNGLYKLIESSYKVKPFLITNYKINGVEQHSFYSDIINENNTYSIYKDNWLIQIDNEDNYNITFKKKAVLTINNISTSGDIQATIVLKFETDIPYDINELSDITNYLYNYNTYLKADVYMFDDHDNHQLLGIGTKLISVVDNSIQLESTTITLAHYGDFEQINVANDTIALTEANTNIVIINEF